MKSPPFRFNSSGFVRLSLAALVAAGALAVAGCSSIDATTTPYVGVKHLPATKPESVMILRKAPTLPYDKLGEVLVDATTEPAPAIEKVEARLREEAAALGADAVYIVYDRIQPVGAYVNGGPYDRTVSVENGHRLLGVAIKYRQ